MNYYKLCGDLPFIKSGTIYFKNVDKGYGVDGDSYLPLVDGLKNERFAIHKDFVEENYDWFEKVYAPNILSLRVHRESRKKEIVKAIEVREKIGFPIPKEWLAELESLESFLKD